MDFSQSNITLICNLILLGIFILVLLSCLTGLKKGLVKATLKLIVWIILILIVYLNNMNVAKLLYNFNLTTIVNWFNLTTVSINNTDISLTQCAGDIVSDIIKSYNISASLSAVNALALSVLSFFTLIISMLLCLLISPILTFLLYILIVRPLFKNSMKKHKLRLGGFFVNGLKTALVSAAFLSPLFSTAEVLLRNYNDALDENYKYDKDKSNEYWNIIQPIMQGYDNSLLHFTFSLITGQGKANNYFSTKVEGTNTPVNFVNLIGDAFSIACSTLSVAEDVSNGALISAALTDKTLELVTTKLLNNVFVTKEIIPIAASIALNMIDENNGIISKEDAEKLSSQISDIDFGKDLSSYVELIRILNEEGYISQTITSNSFDYELSHENKLILKKGLNEFKKIQNTIKNNGKKTLLEVVLPPVLISLTKNLNNDEKENPAKNFINILPSTEEEYRKIDMIQMLDDIVDVIFNFNDLYVKAKELNHLDNNNLKISDFQKLDNGVMLDALFSKELINNNDLNILSLLNGTEDSQGNKLTKGLLDIEFVNNNIKEVFKAALTFIKEDEEMFTKETIDSINDKIDSINSTKEYWSNEFTYLFKFVSEVFENKDLNIINKLNENGKVTGISINSNPTIDLANKVQKDALKKALLTIEDSDLIPSIATPIIKNVLNSQFDKNSLIDVNNLNLEYFKEGNGLIKEIIELIDSYSTINPLLDGTPLLELNLNTEDFKEIFDMLLDCEIINPDSKIAEEHNITNCLRSLIIDLLSSKDMQDMGFIFNETIYDSCQDLRKEFYNLAEILGLICNDQSSLNALLDSSKKLTINDINPNEIEDLINHVAKSDFIRPSLGNILDKNVKPILKELNTIKIDENDINFKIIDEIPDENEKIIKWQNEGTQLKNILTSVQNIGDTPFDKANRNDVESLINALVDSNIFGPKLGKILNNNKTEFIPNNIINSTYIDFETIDRLANNDENIRKEMWHEESAHLCDILSALNDLKNEKGEFDFGMIIEDSNNKEKVKKLINPLVEVYFLSDPYNFENDEYNYDRFGLILFDLIKENFNNYLDNETLIKKDFSFAIDNSFFVTFSNQTTELNQTSVDKTTRSQRWQTELDKFYDIIFRINSLKNAEGKIIIDFSNVESVDNIKSIVLGEGQNKGINDLFFMRTILTNVVKKSINDEFINDNDIKVMMDDSSLCFTYLEALDNELNFKSNYFKEYIELRNHESFYNETYTFDEATMSRELEILARKYELNRIFNVFNEICSNLNSLSTSTEIKIDNVKDYIISVMTNLHDSVIFNNLSHKTSDYELTTFEAFMFNTMNKSNITSMSYIDEFNMVDDKTYMKEKIKDLRNPNIGVSWWEEINAIKTMISMNELNNELVDSLMNNIESISNDILNELLNNFNNSYLAHDICAYFSKKTINNANVSNYIIDPINENTSFNFYIDKDQSFVDKKNTWSKEINSILNIRTALTYKDETGVTHTYDFNVIDFSAGQKYPELESLLPALHSSNIVKPAFNDLLYSMIDKVGFAENISQITLDPSTKNSEYKFTYKGDALAIKKQKRDTLRFLDEKRVVSWLIEGRQLDNCIEIKSQIDNIQMDGDHNDSQINDILKVFSLSYTYLGEKFTYADETNNYDQDLLYSDNLVSMNNMIDDSKYERSYILSELLLNRFDTEVKKVNNSITYFEDIKYDYSYLCFNDYEKEAISSILRLRTVISSLNYQTYDPLNPKNAVKEPLLEIVKNDANFIKLGPSKNPQGIAKVLDSAEKLLFNGYNSKIATQFIGSNYFENAFNASPLGQFCMSLNNGVGLENFFTLDNNPIQYTATVTWVEKINNL